MYRDKSKLPILVILVLTGEAITTTMVPTIQLPTVITTTRATATTTLAFAPHSNIISDYIFQGIYTVKVLVLKRFVPSR